MSVCVLLRPRLLAILTLLLLLLQRPMLLLRCCNNVLDSNLTFLISVAGNHTAYNEQDDGYEQSENSDDEMNEEFDEEPREGHPAPSLHHPCTIPANLVIAVL